MRRHHAVPVHRRHFFIAARIRQPCRASAAQRHLHLSRLSPRAQISLRRAHLDRRGRLLHRHLEAPRRSVVRRRRHRRRPSRYAQQPAFPVHCHDPAVGAPVTQRPCARPAVFAIQRRRRRLRNLPDPDRQPALIRDPRRRAPHLHAARRIGAVPRLRRHRRFPNGYRRYHAVFRHRRHRRVRRYVCHIPAALLRLHAHRQVRRLAQPQDQLTAAQLHLLRSRRHDHRDLFLDPAGRLHHNLACPRLYRRDHAVRAHRRYARVARLIVDHRPRARRLERRVDLLASPFKQRHTLRHRHRNRRFPHVHFARQGRLALLHRDDAASHALRRHCARRVYFRHFRIAALIRQPRRRNRRSCRVQSFQRERLSRRHHRASGIQRRQHRRRRRRLHCGHRHDAQDAVGRHPVLRRRLALRRYRRLALRRDAAVHRHIHRHVRWHFALYRRFALRRYRRLALYSLRRRLALHRRDAAVHRHIHRHVRRHFALYRRFALRRYRRLALYSLYRYFALHRRRRLALRRDAAVHRHIYRRVRRSFALCGRFALRRYRRLALPRLNRVLLFVRRSFIPDFGLFLFARPFLRLGRPRRFHKTALQLRQRIRQVFLIQHHIRISRRLVHEALYLAFRQLHQRRRFHVAAHHARFRVEPHRHPLARTSHAQHYIALADLRKRAALRSGFRVYARAFLAHLRVSLREVRQLRKRFPRRFVRGLSSRFRRRLSASFRARRLHFLPLAYVHD